MQEYRTTRSAERACSVSLKPSSSSSSESFRASDVFIWQPIVQMLKVPILPPPPPCLLPLRVVSVRAVPVKYISGDWGSRPTSDAAVRPAYALVLEQIAGRDGQPI